MFRTLTLSTAVALMAAGPVLAGGLNEPAPAPAPAPPPPLPAISTSDWTGFYAGGSLGRIDVEVDGGAFDDGDGFGIHGGYMADLGTFVVGGEGEFSRYDLSTGPEADVLRLKGRVGYDAGSFLPYVTAGFAQVTVDDLGIDDGGYFYGIGGDFAVTDTILVGAEYLVHEFDDQDALSGSDLGADTLALRASFKF